MLGFNPKSEAKNFECLWVSSMGVIACIKQIRISLDIARARVVLFCIIGGTFPSWAWVFHHLAVFSTWQRIIQDISRALHCCVAIV